MNLSPERPVSALELPERPSRARTSRRALVGAALLLWGGVLWLYAPARRFDYVDFDDGVYVSGNAHVLTGLSISNALWAVTWNEGGNWHPVTWWSLMLDGTLFGARPAVFHMVNVVFHGLNAVLFFGVLVVLTGRWWPALAAAALFAVHPLRVESVAWITERKDVLASFFLLVSLLAYLRYVRRRRARWLGSSVALYILSLMSKAVAPAYPLLLLALDFGPLDRWASAPWKARLRMVVEKMAWWIPAAGLGGLVAFLQWRAGTVASLADTPWSSRFTLLGLSACRYVLQFFWPVNLSFFYPYRDPGGWTLPGVLALLGVAGVTFAAWRSRRTMPWFFSGWAWYLLTLLPVSGLLRLGGVAFADHYTYLPHMGLSFILAWLFAVATRRIPAAGRVMLAAGILLVLASGSRRQMQFWQNNETLFQRAVQVDPANDLALTNLGALRAQQGRIAEALEFFERAMAAGSRDVLLYFNAGNAYMTAGDEPRAEKAFTTALALDPLFVPAGRNLGLLYARQGRWEEALYCLQTACRLNPEDAGLFRLLETVQQAAGQPSGAP